MCAQMRAPAHEYNLIFKGKLEELEGSGFWSIFDPALLVFLLENNSKCCIGVECLLPPATPFLPPLGPSLNFTHRVGDDCPLAAAL